MFPCYSNRHTKTLQNLRKATNFESNSMLFLHRNRRRHSTHNIFKPYVPIDTQKHLRNRAKLQTLTRTRRKNRRRPNTHNIFKPYVPLLFQYTYKNIKKQRKVTNFESNSTLYLQKNRERPNFYNIERVMEQSKQVEKVY